jgi:hypothetical protein
MIEGYESKGTNIAWEDDYVKPEDVEDFGADFKPLPTSESYYPTRLEYFAGKALQGLVVGRSEKDLTNVSKVAKRALALSEALEDAIDSAED